MGPKLSPRACRTDGHVVWLRPATPAGNRDRRPYNGAALSSSEPAAKAGTVFCRSCGKSIEAGARFCRFCGKSQADPIAGPASVGSSAASASHHRGSGVEYWLSQLFPRHHLQDNFTHFGTIAAFLMALIGFVVGFLYNYGWLGSNFLLGSIALLLFLILRESTLSHIRVRDGGSSASSASSSSSAGGNPDHPARRP